MTSPRKVLFVVSDGGRARLIRRKTEGGGYVTIEEIDNADTLRELKVRRQANPSGRVFESVGRLRHGIGTDDSARLAKETFVAGVADRAAALARREGLDEAYLAAPPALMGVLRDRLTPQMAVCGTVNKDLTRVVDQDLGPWLDEARYHRAPIG